ncbi:MAG: hypothetical protein ACYCQI_16355, partial [Gammaproteobacteria bacterium]
VAFEKRRFSLISHLLTTHVNKIDATALIQFKDSILSADQTFLPEAEKERWLIELFKHFMAKNDVSQAEDILTRYPKIQIVPIPIPADVLSLAAKNSNLKFADYVLDRKDLMSAYKKDELGVVLDEYVKNGRQDYAAKLLQIRSDISLNDPMKIASAALAKYKDVILSADDKALPEAEKERLAIELFKHFIARPDLTQAEDILERYKKIQSIPILIPIDTLRLAVKSNHKFVDYVLDRKDLMSAYKKDELGLVLTEFVQHGRFDYVDKLLKIRPDTSLNVPEHETELTPLAIICEQKSDEASFNFLKKLCSEVKNIATDYFKQRSLINLAAANKDLTVFKYFISTPDIFNKFTTRSKVFALASLLEQGQETLKFANDYWNQLTGLSGYPELLKSALFAFIANQKLDTPEEIEKIENILNGQLNTTFKENASFLTFITQNRRSALEFVLKDDKLLKSFSKDQLGQFLVSLAQQKLFPEVKKLLDLNLNISKDWIKKADLVKALMTAAAEDNIEQVKMLMKESILSLCSATQLTELFLSLIKKGHYTEATFLDKSDYLKYINPCQKDEKTENTILHLLAGEAKEIELLKKLPLESDDFEDAFKLKNSNGETVLDIAFKAENYAAIHYFFTQHLEKIPHDQINMTVKNFLALKELDENSKNMKNQVLSIILDYYLYKPDHSLDGLAKQLLIDAHDIDIDKNYASVKKGSTALHYLPLDKELLSKLLQDNKLVNALNKEDQTFLLHAISEGRYDILEFCIKEQPEILNQFSDINLFLVFSKLIENQKYELASLLVTAKPDLVKALDSDHLNAEQKFDPLYHLLQTTNPRPDLKLIQAIAEKSNYFFQRYDDHIIRAIEKEQKEVIPCFINNRNILAKYNDDQLEIVFVRMVQYNMLDFAKQVLESRKSPAFLEMVFWQASRYAQGKPFIDDFLNNKALIDSFSPRAIDSVMHGLISSGQYDQAERLLSMKPELPPTKAMMLLDEVVKMPNPSKAMLDYLFKDNGYVKLHTEYAIKESKEKYSLLACAAIFKRKSILNWALEDKTNIFKLEGDGKNLATSLIYLLNEKEYDLAFLLLEKLFNLIGPLNKSSNSATLKLFQNNVSALLEPNINGLTVLSMLLLRQPDKEDLKPAYRRLLESCFKNRYENDIKESRPESRRLYESNNVSFENLIAASKNKNFDFLEMYLRCHPDDIPRTIEVLMFASGDAHQVHIDNILNLINVLTAAKIDVRITHKTINQAFSDFDEGVIRKLVHPDNFLKDETGASRFLRAIDTNNIKAIQFFINDSELIKKMSPEELGKALYKFATKLPPWTKWIIDLFKNIPEEFNVLKSKYMERSDLILWRLLEEPPAPKELILRCCRESDEFKKDTLDRLLKEHHYESIAIVIERCSKIPKDKLDQTTSHANRELVLRAMNEFLNKDEHLSAPLSMRVSFLNNISIALTPADAPLIQARLIAFLTKNSAPVARDEKDEKKSSASTSIPASPYSDLSCLKNLANAFPQPKEFHAIVKSCLTEMINQSQSQTDLLALMNYLKGDIKSFPFYYTPTKKLFSSEWGKDSKIYVTGEMVDLIKSAKDKFLDLAKKDIAKDPKKEAFAPGVEKFILEPVSGHADYSKKDRYIATVAEIARIKQNASAAPKA